MDLFESLGTSAITLTSMAGHVARWAPSVLQLIQRQTVNGTIHLSRTSILLQLGFPPRLATWALSRSNDWQISRPSSLRPHNRSFLWPLTEPGASTELHGLRPVGCICGLGGAAEGGQLAVVPKRAPIPAVNPMAIAPQKTTRIAAT